jgi:SAM-dependent methyltransferase
MGFDAPKLCGIELLPERLAQARTALPAALVLHGGDALQAPMAPGSMDIVYLSTVLSSLLDDAYQQRLADTLWAWLKPGGALLVYDFTVNNPRNPDVRGVPLARLRALFPQARMRHRRVTLAPPLARAVVRLHPGLYDVCNALPLLRTHVLAWLQKPATAPDR